MTPDGFRAILETLGWDANRLSILFRIDSRTARRWVSGAAALPPAIAAWFVDLKRLLDRIP